jgi:hypothetical protein
LPQSMNIGSPNSTTLVSCMIVAMRATVSSIRPAKLRGLWQGGGCG